METADIYLKVLYTLKAGNSFNLRVNVVIAGR